MFSYKSGIPVAKIYGTNSERIVYLKEDSGDSVDDLFDIDMSLMAELRCPYCGKDISRKDNLKRHIVGCPEKRIYDRMKERAKHMKSGFTEFDFHRGTVQPLPNEKIREVGYIAGPSGSGKSYYVANYLRECEYIFPDKKIILFTTIPEDENFLDIDMIKIDVNDDLLEGDPIDAKEELYNSIVVFDDIINSKNKELTKYMIDLRDDIICNMRDQSGNGEDSYVLATNHLLSDYKSTRTVLHECNFMTVYPKCGGESIKKCLKSYFGLGREQIKKILTLPSRWATIYKRYPPYVLHERGGFIL